MIKEWEGKLNSKEDFRKLLLEILRPLLPYYSEEKAELILGVTATNYDQKAIRLEAFSRPLWGLVPLWAGGGSAPEFEQIYREALRPALKWAVRNIGAVFMPLTSAS